MKKRLISDEIVIRQKIRYTNGKITEYYYYYDHKNTSKKMNKRQRKKKLKQQENTRQLNNENTQRSAKTNECCNADQNPAKKEPILSDDTKPSEENIPTPGKHPEPDTKVIASDKKTKWKTSKNILGRLPKKMGHLVQFAFFSISLLFLEFVISCSTNRQFMSHYGVYITLFCLGYGLILQWITTLTKWERVNHILQVGCLLLTSILFCVIYFVYCEFQLFYDLNTLLAGASDAMADFSGDIIAIILTPDGMLHLLLFLSPLFLYVLFAKKCAFAKPTNFKTKGLLLTLAVCVLLINTGLIYLNQADRNAYTKEYHYDSAIAKFGLLTGLRFEIKNTIFADSKKVEFEAIEITDNQDATENNTETSSSVDKTNETEETLIPTGKNELEIDFSLMAEKDSGIYAELDKYVESLQASSKNEYTGLFEGKNLIFITAEAFTQEVIDENLTPTLYRLANRGIQFTDFYQPSSAGTTGGEYSNLFGMLPTAGGNSVKKTATHLNQMTLASLLSEKGYYGKAYHNNDYTYYDRHKTHINLGFSDGYEGVGNGLENVITAQWPESDSEMIQGTLSTYIQKEPFYIYYMTVSGHSLYDFSKNAMSKKHQEKVKHLEYSEPVKAYIACQLELEEALTYLVKQLEKSGMADDTVIVICADHFPYGLDQESGSMTNLQELYGVPIENDFVRDHNRLIIWSGCLEKNEPIVVDTPVSSIDILPTLCNLFAVDFDSRLLPGRDVFSDAQPLVYTLGYDWKTDKGTYLASRGKFIPNHEGEDVSEDYIENMKNIVANKITYSKNVLKKDYFRHLFGEE